MDFDLEDEFSARRAVLIWEIGVYPPSPHPLNAALGAGFAKSLRKILSPKGLEVKILRTKELRQILLWLDILRPPLPIMS